MKAPLSIFFDLDSTLLDNTHHHRALEDACHQVTERVPGLEAERLLKANQEVWNLIRARIMTALMQGNMDSATATRETWRRTLAACGYEDDATVELAAQAYQQAERRHYRLYDDVSGLVHALRQANMPLALITNGPSGMQRNKLNALGIERWFKAVAISGEVGVGKPNPGIFYMVLREMNFEPSDVWFVGDSLENDIAGANAAGITSVWLNRDGALRDETTPKPDIEIGALTDFHSLLSLDHAEDGQDV